MTDDAPARQPQIPPARQSPDLKRGYWIEPPSSGAPESGGSGATPKAPAGDPTASPVSAAAPGPSASSIASRQAPGPSAAQRPAAAAPRAGRARAGRKRRLWRLGVLVLVLAGVATTLVLVLTGKTVVPVVSENLFPIRYEEDIARVSGTYDLDPYLVAAVAKTESGFDPRAVSPVGAVGLMQVMPATAEWITGLDRWQGGDEIELTDPADNLELGACYLAYLLDRFGDGNRQAALAAYNAGPTAVSAWVEAAGGVESFGLEDIRYDETRNFVRRVEWYRFLYVRVHPGLFAEAGGTTVA